MKHGALPRLLFPLAAVVTLSGTTGCANSASLSAGADGGPGNGGSGLSYSSGGAGTSRCGTSAEFSCGGDPSTGGDSPGSGGDAESGGASGSGGAGGSLGSGGSQAGDGGVLPGTTIEVCPGEDPPHLVPSSFPSCPSIASCNVSRCVPINALPKGVPSKLLGTCGDAATPSVCVPDEYILTYGDFLAKTCKSIAGAEGRCISTCVPQVNGLADALPQDVCGDLERCAPCINPNDGTATGACTLACDKGPSAATVADPNIFKTCEGDGRCVPKEIVPAALLARLTILTNTGCTDATTVCAPVVKSQNLKYNFPSCVPGSFSAIGAPNTDSKGTVTQWGGCVPSWLAGAESLFLAQMTCATGELCAPCHDPLTPDPKVPFALEDPTGACPVPLPSDPSGGLPPAGAGGIAGIAGAPVTWGTPGTGSATGAGGTSSAGGTSAAP